MAKAIYRVYRPATFSDVSGQEHVVKTLQNQFAAGTLAHAYLFMGPRGVGKTTTARLIAKLVNCEKPKDNEPCNKCSACVQVAEGHSLDIYEIDAASHTDVDNVRENIIKSVRFAPNQLNKKVYIIDEVHMLSTSAFNALLKTLEEPPDHVLFVLATTEIHKVPETIISRCQRFDFKRIPQAELIARMQRILKAEKVKVAEDVLSEIARHSGGCARDAESLLGQVLALGEKEISMEEASLVLPATQMVLVEEFVAALVGNETSTAITRLNAFIEQGVDVRHFVRDVVQYLRDRLLETVSGEKSEYSVGFLQLALEELMKAERGVRGEQIPQLPVELAIIRICGLGGQPVVALKSEPKDFKKQGADSVQVPEEKKEEVIIPEAQKPEPAEFVSPVQEVVVPETVETKETVFDSVPVVDLAEVKKKWPQVYDQIKACNASLPMMMKTCELTGVSDNRVELGFAYDLYVDTVNKEKNRTLIEGVFEQVLGKVVRVKAIKKMPEAEDPTIQNLVQEFGGSVV
jgi:DNA polymerase III subunit gamma/tau